jgi:large conductance mechanosensitive channel
MLKGFKTFIMRGNVVDLAIAVVIGAAFGAVISSFVADILTPLIAAIFGKPNFAELSFTVHHSVFFYGALINALITFAAIAAAVYFFLVAPLNHMAARRAAGAEPTPADEVAQDIALLTEIRDLLAQQSGPPSSS